MCFCKLNTAGCPVFLLVASILIAPGPGTGFPSTGPATLPAARKSPVAAEMSIKRQKYGTTQTGDPVTLFTCTNSQGNSMSLIDYGATMISLVMPDRDGNRENIILTCDGMDAWENCQSYFGCVAGRYCNRIAKGKFSILGQQYELAVNNEPNHLHGGTRGFDKVMWNAEPMQMEDGVGIRFTYVSPDGEEGYPGKLTVVAEFVLNNKNYLTNRFRATTDKPTHLNLTNHNYWNLAGHDSGTHLNQELRIEADKYVEADGTLIPTGILLDVDGSPLDFRTFHKIGERLDKIGGEVRGYDHCYVIRDYDGSMRPAATARDPESGRTMEILSTQPGLQFYTGNFLDGGPGSGGYEQYSGFCLETQHYPDSPNRPKFPKTLLRPGEQFMQTTIWKFSAS